MKGFYLTVNIQVSSKQTIGLLKIVGLDSLIYPSLHPTFLRLKYAFPYDVFNSVIIPVAAGQI